MLLTILFFGIEKGMLWVTPVGILVFGRNFLVVIAPTIDSVPLLLDTYVFSPTRLVMVNEAENNVLDRANLSSRPELPSQIAGQPYMQVLFGHDLHEQGSGQPS